MMRTLYSHSRDKIVSQLQRDMSSCLPEAPAIELEPFLHSFLVLTDSAELASCEHSHFVSSTLSFWQFIQVYKGPGPHIKIFNPTQKEHGWHSTRTIIHLVDHNRPFIIDSVRMKLNEWGPTIHQVRNCVISPQRDSSGKMVVQGDGTCADEAVLYMEIDAVQSESKLAALLKDIEAVLADVSQVVSDFATMKQKAAEVADHFLAQPGDEEKEAARFLQWLLEGNFTFLAYEEMAGAEQQEISPEQPCEVCEQPAVCLGLLRHRDTGQIRREQLRYSEFANERAVLSCGRATVRSSVHRPVYPVCFFLNLHNSADTPVKQVHITGLYTAKAYTENTRTIPWLRSKVDAIVQMAGFDADSHLGKELLQVIERFPREELFLTPQEELYGIVLSILQMRERSQVRVFISVCEANRFCSVLIYVPREIYDTRLRVKMQEILCDRFGAVDAEFKTWFSDSILARVHYVLRLPDTLVASFDTEAITAEIIQASLSWDQGLRETLQASPGKKTALDRELSVAFSLAYKEAFTPADAVADIECMRNLSEKSPLSMRFYQPLDDDAYLHFKLFHQGLPLPLSDQIPVMENLGLKVMEEHPYSIEWKSGTISLHDFALLPQHDQSEPLHALAEKFQDAFVQTWYGHVENDRFNLLVLTCGINWRYVNMFRAYSRYLKQIGFSFSQDYIADTLCHNSKITVHLLQLFSTCFDPDLSQTEGQRQARRQQLQQNIVEALEGVSVLSEDRVLRRMMDLVAATLRTNFYQKDSKGEFKEYIVFKFAPGQIPDMPQPAPMFEIFVYSPVVEGVHLRGGKVARGGLRWSDRVEDFRTEVLGLAKAQQVKNTVIVPVGAKGGFIPKKLPANAGREEILQHGIACYKTFIRGLLDVTDNLVDQTVVHPERVIRYDESDTYLVVAADKGTATFSDIANGIAREYNFWLGDAFASGGSVGYDHKKMGITTRGAWISVQRHFREKGVNIQQDPVSVVGIGDMSGDVFGNGLLSSPQLRLVAAFNHQHIFIDPTPDPDTSFVERRRLFNLPRSSWDDYDRSVISAGGGVYSRQMKSIMITDQMRKVLNIKSHKLTPNELITAILKAPVDLLWNGGIGTYVKAARESHADVGDKGNDAVRIDGSQLRAKVVGEGGNLGLTQLARVECALNGTALNSDFIDNSAGVDCSDHEVNIKIFLNQVMATGDMSHPQRDALLEKMTNEVARLVLDNNYRQTQAITLAELEAGIRHDDYRRALRTLESAGRINRAIEYLPDDESLTERESAGKWLTRPELSVLIAYSKADLKERLLASSLPDDIYLGDQLYTAFPQTLTKKYAKELRQHPLYRQIVATQLANSIVHMMGVPFINRQKQSTGAGIDEVVRAFFMARDIFDAPGLWSLIESLDYHVESSLQHELIFEIRQLLRRSTRLIIRTRLVDHDSSHCITEYRTQVDHLISGLQTLLPKGPRAKWEARTERLQTFGIEAQSSQRLACIGYLFNSLSIIQAAEQTECTLEHVTQMFYAVSEHMQLTEFYDHLGQQKIENHWQSLVRDGIRDELAVLHRTLVVNILRLETEQQEINGRLLYWSERHSIKVEQWYAVLAEIKGATSTDLAIYTVAMRKLADITQQA